MIYISADDYGLCDEASMHILECIEKGALHKVSVFPNLEAVDLSQIVKYKNVRVALHLNLVEGACMADADEIDLLTDKNGNFKNTFGGLFKHNLLHGKKLRAQVYKEIKAQVLFWKSILPKDTPFCIDSHQHTHMLPAVFRALLQVLEDEKITPEYMRIPIEPVFPYIKTPSLYFSYSAVNCIKQWLLKLLWLANKRRAKQFKISPAYFLGVLFSGKMDAERVHKILKKYDKKAENDGRDIEVLFHPGYLEKSGNDAFKNKNIVFEKFYLSENRKTEFMSVMKMTERSVL